jgi:hypothetical protein
LLHYLELQSPGFRWATAIFLLQSSPQFNEEKWHVPSVSIHFFAIKNVVCEFVTNLSGQMHHLN